MDEQVKLVREVILQSRHSRVQRDPRFLVALQPAAVAPGIATRRRGRFRTAQLTVGDYDLEATDVRLVAGTDAAVVHDAIVYDGLGHVP